MKRTHPKASQMSAITRANAVMAAAVSLAAFAAAPDLNGRCDTANRESPALNGQQDRYAVATVPEALRGDLRLAPFYEQHVSARGFAVLASAKASPFALREAAYLIDQMLGERQDVREAMVRNKVRFAVMAVGELTTDVPEHSDLEPKDYWDSRARGLGPTPQRPCVSCGEENLLCLPGDPYAAENILVHEFAHAIHEMGVRSLDPTFDARLKRAYDEA